MRIIFSTYDDLKNPYYGGGGAFAVHSVAKRLINRHNVTILTGKYPKCKNEVIDGVNYKRIGYSVGQPQADQLLYQFCLPFSLLANDFDIWFECYTPPFSTAFLPWFTDRPVVGVTHLLGAEEMSKKYHLPFRRIETLGLRQYKNIVVLSEYLAGRVKASKSTARISIIPNGLDSEILNRVIDKREDHILFLGRLDIFQKGLDVLLDAYKQVSDAVPYNLLLAGSGSPKDINALKDKIQRLSLENRVILLGKASGSRKYELLEHAILTIIPSRVEAMALVALEAMASKCPLVISDIESFKWVPGNCAVRAESYTADSFASAIISLVKNPNLRKLMGEAGHSAAKAYNWDAIAGRYDKLVQKLAYL